MLAFDAEKQLMKTKFTGDTYVGFKVARKRILNFLQLAADLLAST